ncbi:hypothetical protein [Pararhodobacter sp.]
MAARAEKKTVEKAPRGRRLCQTAGALAGALGMFFVLKAAALAHSNHPLVAVTPIDAGIAATLHHWFAGADPVTRTLAMAMRPGASRNL